MHWKLSLYLKSDFKQMTIYNLPRSTFPAQANLVGPVGDPFNGLPQPDLYTASYNIDPWGNLNSVNAVDVNNSPISGGAGMGVPAAADTNNRLGGMKYDQAGNVTWDGANSYQYDAESRVAATAVIGGSPQMYYLYNGDGERVAKLNASQAANLNAPSGEGCPNLWTNPIGGPVPIGPIFSGTQAVTPVAATNATITWGPVGPAPVMSFNLLDAKLYWGAEPKAESDVCGNPTKEYIYLNGKRIAYQDWTDATGGVYYYFSDHLGSASVVTDDQGDVIDESDYYPYGGENILATGSGQAYKFTGKERDDESGNDYFGARYYSSNMGRWMSPDWEAKPTAVPYADFADPQSLNLYGYVLNNPLSKRDADGHCCDSDSVDSAIDFGIGVLRGAASSISFGAVGAPSSSDSVSSLTGQALGTSVVGAAGTDLAVGGGPAAIEGLLAAPVTGGTSLLESAGALAAPAIGTEMVAGAAKNTTAIAMASAAGSKGAGPAPGTKGGKKDRTAEGKQEQREGISRAQKQTNKSSQGNYGMTTGKSDQAEQQQHKSYKNLKDAEEAHQ
jgi:RHS repeat-associated protein